MQSYSLTREGSPRKIQNCVLRIKVHTNMISKGLVKKYKAKSVGFQQPYENKYYTECSQMHIKLG